MKLQPLLILCVCFNSMLIAVSRGAEPIDIGSRRELFVDRHLIEKLDGVRLQLHRPQPREVAMEFDLPWERHAPGYVTVFQDRDLYRMYYRAMPDGAGDASSRQVTCYAESKDGIHWSRPELGLVGFGGSGSTLGNCYVFNLNLGDGPRGDRQSHVEFRYNNGQMQFRRTAIGTGDHIADNKPFNEWFIAAVVDPAAGNLRYIENGVEQKVHSPSAKSDANGAANLLGRRGTGGGVENTLDLNFHLAEFIIYDRVLSAEELVETSGHLAAKYGMGRADDAANKAGYKPAPRPAVWLDASDADAVQVSDRDVVALKDKSGHGHHFDAKTATANQPNYVTQGGPGERPYIVFDDGNDEALGNATYLPAAAKTIFIVMRVPRDMGSTANNIIGRGVEHHCFTPMKDANPNCPAEARYKAVGGPYGGPLQVFQSPDGIRWKAAGRLPLQGNFDSQNLVFWDEAHGQYRAYWRDHRTNDPKVPDGRDVRTAVSKDFTQWSERRWLDYDPGRNGTTQKPADPGSAHQFYTNGIQPYHRAPHLLLGFPMRYIDRGWTASTDALPDAKRRRELADKKVGGGRPTREGTAITDVMFMASRDGERFFVWPEAIVRPGVQRPGSWFYGSTWYSHGIVETEPLLAGAPRELSIYISENARQKTPQRLRRYTFRMDGFASAHASLHGGELLTTPITFNGDGLQINFATSAGGSLRVEIQDVDGNAKPGFAMSDCHLLYGDQIDRVVPWNAGTDVGQLAGQPVRLKFELKDADLYSFQFAASEGGKE